MYILGGHYGSCHSAHYRITSTGSSWEGRAAYPRPIHRHLVVVDSVKQRLYVFGGHDCSHTRSEAYYYSPGTNSWTQISNMPWAALDVAGTIVTQKNGERWIMLMRPSHSDMYYWNLETESGYTYMGGGTLQHSERMSMISLTPYTAFMLGGRTSSDGVKNINFWIYNPERTRFEKPNRYIQQRQRWNYWTVAKKNNKALASCTAERTYAAVGWGGSHGVSSGGMTVLLISMCSTLSGASC